MDPKDFKQKSFPRPALLLLILLAAVPSSFLLLRTAEKVRPRLAGGNGLVAPYYKNEDLKLPADVRKKVEQATESAKIRVPIVMYHYIEYVKDLKDFIRVRLNITPAIFESQLATIKGAGYTTIFVKDLADYLNAGKTLPHKPIILTFDDGYRDFYTDAFPLLKKYNLMATIYAVPGFLDTPNYLTTAQLTEIAGSGLVEVAAHTVHHAYLKGLSTAKARAEIDGSKKELEQIIQRPVFDFAYPYGAFDSQTETLVKQAGFLTAASVIPGVRQSKTNQYFLYRLRIGALSGKTLVNFLDTHQ